MGIHNTTSSLLYVLKCDCCIPKSPNDYLQYLHRNYKLKLILDNL